VGGSVHHHGETADLRHAVHEREVDGPRRVAVRERCDEGSGERDEQRASRDLLVTRWAVRVVDRARAIRVRVSRGEEGRPGHDGGQVRGAEEHGASRDQPRVRLRHVVDLEGAVVGLRVALGGCRLLLAEDTPELGRLGLRVGVHARVAIGVRHEEALVAHERRGRVAEALLHLGDHVEKAR
jgi:hypothetical protein